MGATVSGGCANAVSGGVGAAIDEDADCPEGEGVRPNTSHAPTAAPSSRIVPSAAAITGAFEGGFGGCAATAEAAPHAFEVCGTAACELLPGVPAHELSNNVRCGGMDGQVIAGAGVDGLGTSVCIASSAWVLGGRIAAVACSAGDCAESEGRAERNWRSASLNSAQHWKRCAGSRAIARCTIAANTGSSSGTKLCGGGTGSSTILNNSSLNVCAWNGTWPVVAS